MGNLCGRESSSNFQGEGRTLGSAPAARPASTPNKAPVPAAAQKSSPGRTLGGSSASTDADPKSNAAKAAEVT